MSLDKCSRCGEMSLAVRETTYDYYCVPVLKCTNCDTVFGVVNQSDEIENIKNAIIKVDKDFKKSFSDFARCITQNTEDIKKMKSDIEKLKK